jgi:hypothetical protein
MLLPANRTTPVPPYIGIQTIGAARNSLRGATVTDREVSNGKSDIPRRPPGSTTTLLALPQKSLAHAQSSQSNKSLKLSTRA